MPLLKKKGIRQVEIPSASMADIAFLLLIFFMVATTIDTDKGIGLILPPPGSETVEVRKENLCNIILDPHGTVLLDNKEVDIRSIKSSLNLGHVRCKSPEMVHRDNMVLMPVERFYLHRRTGHL